MEKQISVPLLVDLLVKARQFRAEPNDLTEKEFKSALELVNKFDRGELQTDVIQVVDSRLRENLPQYSEMLEKYNRKIGGINKER